MDDSIRPAPDAAMVSGAVLAAAGYLLPWFKQGPGYLWSFSGWEYATLSNGGGWTLVTFGWLSVGFVASLWAGRSTAAAMWGAVAGVGALVFALAVVAASFGSVPDRSSINYITEFPLGVGLPLLGAGLGLLLAGACRAIVVTTLRGQPTRTDSLE